MDLRNNIQSVHAQCIHSYTAILQQRKPNIFMEPMEKSIDFINIMTLSPFIMQPSVFSGLSRLSKPTNRSSLDHGTYRTPKKPQIPGDAQPWKRSCTNKGMMGAPTTWNEKDIKHNSRTDIKVKSCEVVLQFHSGFHISDIMSNYQFFQRWDNFIPRFCVEWKMKSLLAWKLNSSWKYIWIDCSTTIAEEMATSCHHLCFFQCRVMNVSLDGFWIFCYKMEGFGVQFLTWCDN